MKKKIFYGSLAASQTLIVKEQGFWYFKSVSWMVSKCQILKCLPLPCQYNALFSFKNLAGENGHLIYIKGASIIFFLPFNKRYQTNLKIIAESLALGTVNNAQKTNKTFSCFDD